jgi:hypothetical protein
MPQYQKKRVLDDEQFKVSEADKKLNREFFGEAYEG